ncbi:hypothetical protein Ancab_031370 [Ancistrocladus abbreviatus]
MGKKNVFCATILLFFIAADVSSASFLWNFRKLAASAPKGSSNGTGSPMPSPSPGNNSREENKTKDEQVTVKNTSVTSPSQKDNDKQLNHNASTTPTDHKENKTEDQVKKEDERKADVPVGSNEICYGMDALCKDSKSMVACIKSYDDVSKTLILLIHNQGDSSFKVNITSPPSMATTKMEILKHQSQTMNISAGSVSDAHILLNAGNGDCVLTVGPSVSERNPFNWLPPYSKFLTPIYGAYILLLATLIAGGLWVCCMFRRRKRHGEIPYQELEMGLPESSLGVETANGWDQGWDDDWDEDKAVKSPGTHRPGSISANGLTSRSANRDGWEEWDD